MKRIIERPSEFGYILGSEKYKHLGKKFTIDPFISEGEKRRSYTGFFICETSLFRDHNRSNRPCYAQSGLGGHGTKTFQK